jgi:signal transduction histidine kinase
LAEPLNFLGIAHNYKGDRLQAYEYYGNALDISTRQGDSLQIAYSNNNLGRLFFEQGLLSRAYEYFIRALDLFEAVNDSSGLAYTYQSLASLYKMQHDYAKAENNYLKANDIRLKLGNTRDIMSAYVQTGRLYQENNQHEKALRYFHLGDSAGNVIRDEINLAEIKTFIAKSYLTTGMLDKADAFCAEGLKVIVEKNNVRMMPHAYITMGQVKFEKRELAKARSFFELALQIATRSKDLNSKMDAHYWLWKLSEKENNTIEILKNHNQYLILKDSVKDLDLARQVERLQFEIEIRNKEQENELLKANHARNAAIIQQQRLQNIVLIIVVAFVSVLGFIQWRSSKKRRESNETLEQQNEFIQNQRREIIEQNEKLYRRNLELSELNHEKDTLMSIVAHDLKSPLNRIKGIVDLMELEGGLTGHQHQYFQMSKDATQAGLDLIKDLLDVHMLEENVLPNYTTFDLSAFILNKIDAYAPIAEAKRIHLQIRRVENEEVNLDADYLHRIMDNLLSNAIKFSKKDSIVDVAAGRSDGHIWISVKDQGPGFSEKDRGQLFQKFKKLSARPTAGETSNGLGLAIVKTLVDRLNGSIHLISEQNKGSEFVIKFPVSNQG